MTDLLREVKTDLDFVKANLHSLYRWACCIEDNQKVLKKTIEDLAEQIKIKLDEVD